MMRRLSLAGVAAALGAAAAACATEAPLAEGELASSFTTSARESGVPRDLLVAIAHVEDGLGTPRLREPNPDAHVVAAGPLMLRRGKLDTLARASALSGAGEIELRADADRALAAGALVLAELAGRTGARPGDLASYRDAVADMSGYADAPHRDDYVHRVYATLARGGSFEGRDGQIVTVAAHPELPPSLTIAVEHGLRVLAGAPDYPGAEWIPTSCTDKCTVGRGGNKVEYVVIHDTEGGWDASVATLQNDPGKSVQYIVGKDGRLAQFVPEADTAWHAGNFWYNQRSVGIEHVGYATQAYPEALYAKSAALVAHLTKKYGIAPDRAHVVGHDQIPNGNKIAQSSPPCALSPKECRTSGKYGGAGVHSDPGVWEWATYMPRVGGRAKCTDVTTVATCSVDQKSAFRCVGDEVVVTACDGPGACEPRGAGDAVCHVSASPSPSSPPGSAPPGSAHGAAPPAVEASPSEESDGGCAIAPGTSGRAPVACAAAILVVGLAGARRRPRRRRRA